MGPTYKAFFDLKAAQKKTRSAVVNVNDTRRIDKQDNDDKKIVLGGGEPADDAITTDGSPAGSGTASSTSAARLKLISWYAGRKSSALAKELYGDEVGQHATPDEASNVV